MKPQSFDFRNKVLSGFCGMWYYCIIESPLENKKSKMGEWILSLLRGHKVVDP